MDAATIEQILAAGVQIITIAAPLIMQTEKNAEPFVKELYGLFTGTNLTIDDVNASLARVNALSSQIQDPSFIEPIQSDDV